MCAHSSVPPSKEFNATMAASSTTSAPARSSCPMAFTFVCHALTPPRKTVKLNASSVLQTMLFAPCCSMRAFPPTSGPLPSGQPPTSLTSYQPKPSSSPHPTLPFLAFSPPTSIFGFLAANAIPTFPPQPPTNLPLAPPYVFFLDTLHITKGTSVLIATQIGSSFPDTLFSTSTPFLLPKIPHQLHMKPLIS